MKSISKILRIFTWVLMAILGIILVYTTLELFALVIRTMVNRTIAFDLTTRTIDIQDLFLIHVQGLIAGVLLVTIIIELIESLLIHLRKDKEANYLLVLFQISAIAIVRHLFIADFEHMNGLNIIGIAFLLLVLGSLILVNQPDKIQNLRDIFSRKNKKG